jgi:hypothetical protein
MTASLTDFPSPSTKVEKLKKERTSHDMDYGTNVLSFNVSSLKLNTTCVCRLI